MNDLDIKTMRIGILGEDGFRREITIGIDGSFKYNGFIGDFKKPTFKILNKEATAQEIVDDDWEEVEVE